MLKKVKELLRSLNFAKKQSTNSKQSASEELVNKYQVPGTAFQIIGNKEKGYFIALGQYRVSDPQKTVQDCQTMIDNKDWDLIVNLMGLTTRLEIDKMKSEAKAEKNGTHKIFKQPTQ